MLFKTLAAIAVIIAAGAGATAWRAGSQARATEAAYPPEGQFIEVGGARIHYVQDGQGPDLVFIHGASGSTRDFTFAMLPALRNRYRVTIFDRPGFGYSTRQPGATIAEQAATLADAAAAIGVERPIVLGQSYGGAVALAWAIERENVAGLVLVSAASNPWSTGIGAYYAALSSGPGQAIMAPLIAAWVPDAVIDSALGSVFEPNEPPEGYAAHIGPRLSLRLPSLRENALQRRALLDQINAQAPLYPSLTLPVEILHGTDDTIVPAVTHSEPLARQLPDANLTLIEGVGHMPHHVATETVLQAIDRLASRAGLR